MHSVADNISDVVSPFGDTILAEAELKLGHFTAKFIGELVSDKLLDKILPIHSSRLETTGVKVLLITLGHKHTISDADLKFYTSPLHS
jgi:hypothetical protein